MVPSRGGEEEAGDRGQIGCTRNTATVAVEPRWMEDPLRGHPVWACHTKNPPSPPHYKREEGDLTMAGSVGFPAPVTLRQLRLPGNEALASIRGQWSEAVETAGLNTQCDVAACRLLQWTAGNTSGKGLLSTYGQGDAGCATVHR